MQDRWWTRGACLGLDTNDFYPERGDKASDGMVTVRAQAVCEGCPVRLPCLDSAMTDEDGVWGGWTGAARTWVRRLGHGCPTCGTELAGAAGGRRPWPRLFCSDECLEAGMAAAGSDAVELDATLEALVAAASDYDRERRRTCPEPTGQLCLLD